MQSTSFSSSVFCNPPWDEVRQLRRWFSKDGAKLLASGAQQSLSVARSDGGSAAYLAGFPLGSLAVVNAIKADFATTNEPLVQPVNVKAQVSHTNSMRRRHK